MGGEETKLARQAGSDCTGLVGKGKELKHFIFNAMWHLVITLSLYNCFFLSLSFFFIFLVEPFGLWYLSSPTRDWTKPSEVKLQTPNHWTTREFPQLLFWKHLVTFRNPEHFTHSIVYSFINMYWAPTCISSCMEIGGLRNWLLGHSLKSCEHFLKCLQST